MPASNVTYGTNTVIVSNTGVYEINYMILLSVSLGATITVSMRNNGTNIAATAISNTLALGTSTLYTASTILSLNAGDALDLAVSALLALSVSLGSGLTVEFTVKRLN